MYLDVSSRRRICLYMEKRKRPVRKSTRDPGLLKNTYLSVILKLFHENNEKLKGILLLTLKNIQKDKCESNTKTHIFMLKIIKFHNDFVQISVLKLKIIFGNYTLKSDLLCV